MNFEQKERDMGSDFGQFSKFWQYQSDESMATVSFDYPFSGWHEVTRCYRNQGWDVLGRKVVLQQPSESAWAYAEVTLAKPTGDSGYLLFSVVDESGQPILPPSSSAGLTSKLFLTKIVEGPAFQLLRNASFSGNIADVSSYQLQLFVATDSELTASQRSDLASLFVMAAKRLQDHWSQGGGRAQ